MNYESVEIEATEEESKLSQFMLVRFHADVVAADGICLGQVGVSDEFLVTVAEHYFGAIESCRLVADPQGKTEPLVDDVCDAQRLGLDIRDTALMKFISGLVRSGIEFVCWSGGDFQKLPIVQSWDKLEHEIRSQTVGPPADLYVHFLPAASA